MQERISTTERLARALEEAKAPQYMIDLARTGFYDDYKADHPAPIALLVQHARAAGLQDIAQRAMHGEFDAQKWEAEAWAKSPDGQETFKMLVEGGPTSMNLGDISGPGPSIKFSRKRRKH